ncbi:MAG TPA: hypothetical protein VI653_03050, partial [Steroidobacteraceae bacterium]
MSTPESVTGVQGERGAPVVNTARSVQSRISSILAASVMIALGVGALSWYYSNALGRQQRLRQAVTTAAASNAQGEMALPPLGKVESAHDATSPSIPFPGAVTSGQTIAGVVPPDSPPPEIGRAPELPLEQTRPSWNPTAGSGAPQRQVASDRRLSGVAFSRESQQATSPGTLEAAGRESGGSSLPAPQAPPGTTGGEEGLTTLLRPSVT